MSIKDRINRLKKKWGLAATIAGVVTSGGYYSFSHQKDEKPVDKVETISDTPEMSYDDQCDACLLPLMLIPEGFTQKAHTDDLGIWTYAIGNTVTMDGRPVKQGDTVKDLEEGLKIAKHHLDNRVDHIFDYITRDLRPEQKAVLQDFAYNCGPGIFVKDGKLTELGKAVNEGRDDYVVEKMLEYNKGGGSFMTGLFSRRVLEALIYQGFIGAEDLQKCVIGGIGNISCSKEFRELFNLKTKKIFVGGKKGKIGKKGRRGMVYKIVGTYDASPIRSKETADLIIKLCQSPVKGKISKKLADFNTGKNVCAFIPKRLLVKNVYSTWRQELAGIIKAVSGNQSQNS